MPFGAAQVVPSLLGGHVDAVVQFPGALAAPIKQRQVRQLDGWLTRASQSSSVELRGFASSIKQDYAAVKAALSLPWSQGQVEGQITRLKCLKRQMYGRARFELLRSRVLRRA